MNEVTLFETVHPRPDAAAAFDSLVGIDDIKQVLVDELFSLLGSRQIEAWEKKHHGRPIALTRRLGKSPPLVLLSGDVGCGKSALASSVGSPVARLLDARVVALETRDWRQLFLQVRDNYSCRSRPWFEGQPRRPRGGSSGWGSWVA